MGAGICVVAVGLLIGIQYESLKAELAYLLSGLLIFSAGQLLAKKK